MQAEISAFRGSYRYYEAEAGDVDMYMVHGPSVIDVVQRLSWLSGRSEPPPRWALGYLGSTMYYTEQADAQGALQKFGVLCRRHGIPCSAFHLSSGYTMNADNQRCVFTWNLSRVPDPPAMFADFHASGMRVVPNIKPWLLTSHPAYASLAKLGGLLKTADGTAPLVGRFWAGGAGTSAPGSYVDFASTAGYDWWVGQVRSALVDYGADAAWNDNNEFEIDDENATCGDAGALVPIGLVGRPLQTLLMARASRDALLASRPEERPFVVTRSGCLGVQRYAQQTWSGDNHTGWQTLKYNLPMGLSLGLCGWAGSGHDVGGFAGPVPDAELFVRWVQQGVLQPRFVIHSGLTTDGTGAYTCNEPWMYPESIPHIRAAILLRYRLLPLLHSLHLEAYLTGRPVARALACHYTGGSTIEESFLYTLGATLLAASVLEPLDRLHDGSWRIALPVGGHLPVEPTADDAAASVATVDAWCDVETGTWYPAGTIVSKPVSIGSVPLFAAAGAMIPFDMNLPGTHDPAASLTAVDAPPPSDLDVTSTAHATWSSTAEHERGIMIFVPPGFTGTLVSTIYDDDGVSTAYARGGYTTLTLRVTAHAAAKHTQNSLEVDISISGPSPRYAGVHLILPPADPRGFVDARATPGRVFKTLQGATVAGQHEEASSSKRPRR